MEKERIAELWEKHGLWNPQGRYPVGSAGDAGLDVIECLTALEAALARAEGVGWQPIETAPTDGTMVLLCDIKDESRWPRSARFGRVPRSARFGRVFDDSPGFATWRDSNCNRVIGMTHWAPLPAAPEPRP